MKFVVKRGKKKTLAVDPMMLASMTLPEIIEDKNGDSVSKDSIVSFDGKKVVYQSGENTEVDIPEDDLIETSAKAWIKKKFKIRGDVTIEVARAAKARSSAKKSQ